jgi:GDP-4-dehydro-6-deoxy-D-mannose reductase
VTGATGFVGRWLVEELRSAGHEPVATPPSRELEITDAAAISRFIGLASPEAIVHLAGLAYAGDASRDPSLALEVNEGGTQTVLGVALQHGSPPVLVAGSSEVYGRPDPHDLPLRETAPLRAEAPYGRSKLAQERAALEVAATGQVPVVVTRSFNMIGPGQRSEFVAPALARRVLDARRTGAREIAVGNIDVRRDFCDVRDAVRAYRLIIEGLAAGAIGSGAVLNVARGRSTSIRRMLEILCDIVGISVRPRADPALVRDSDPPEIVGDATRLNHLTGWEPSITVERTLADLVASIKV